MGKAHSDVDADMREKLARALAKEVSEQGRKYKWLATKAGVDESYLGAIMRGDKPGSLPVLIKIGNAIGLELHAEWRKK